MSSIRRFAVLGDPIAHSKSPTMHAAAYRALSLSCEYEAIHCQKSDLRQLVERLRRGEFEGFNVTVPHKQTILEYVDELDASVSLAGAANTLVRSDQETVVAYNTDQPAVAAELRALSKLRPSDRLGGSALVLGSGGAARSAVAALATDLGASDIVIRARSLETKKGRAFLDEIERALSSVGNTTKITAEPWKPSIETEPSIVALVQATSAGMLGAEPGEDVARAVSWEHLPDEAVALDVVYSPPTTPFLQAAHARGLRSTNGLGMLARQGALAFELWFKRTAPYTEMLTALGD